MSVISSPSSTSISSTYLSLFFLKGALSELITFLPYLAIRGFAHCGVDLHKSRRIKMTRAIFVAPILDATLDCRCHPGAETPPRPYPNPKISRARAQGATRGKNRRPTPFASSPLFPDRSQKNGRDGACRSRILAVGRELSPESRSLADVVLSIWKASVKLIGKHEDRAKAITPISSEDIFIVYIDRWSSYSRRLIRFVFRHSARA
jgi:hypothetical protein